MDSILFIDKPSGITSFDVIRRLREKHRQAKPDKKPPKMGHAGTLDPLASGLLIIGLEKATKELSRFMDLPKTYEVLIEFGKTSTTYDADGVLRITNHYEYTNMCLSREEFEKILKTFIGEIEQTPPLFSAKRIKGERAYDLARRGIAVQLKPARVFIQGIEILEWNWPLVLLRVKCGKGTYIRSLAHDLGQKIGCGGYVKELRRTAIGEYDVSNSIKL